MPEKLFEHKNCVVEHRPDINGVFMVLRGFMNHETYLDVSAKRLEIFEKYKIENMITDSAEMKVLSPESLAYNSEVFVPRLIELGIKRSYMVIAKDMFTKYMMEQVEEKRQQKHSAIIAKYFVSVEEAFQQMKTDIQKTG